MKKLNPALCLILFFFAAACPKKEANDTYKAVDFSTAAVIGSYYNTDTQILSVTVVLQEGIHAYAEGEKIGKPVNLIVSSQNGWKAKGPRILPKGIVTKTGIHNSVVLENTFEIKVPLKQGKGPIKSTLFMQLCTKHQCDKPRQHLISTDTL